MTDPGYRTENIFTYEDNETHSTRKRMISNTFSKSYIMSSHTARASTRDVLFGRLLPLIQRAAKEKQPIELLSLNYAYSMDTFVQWQFGKSLSSNFIEDLEERKMYFDGFFGPAAFTFWQFEFPGVANFLRNFGVFLIPKWVDKGFKEIEDWNLDKCDKAQQLLASGKQLHPDDNPVVFEQAIKSMSRIQSPPHSYPQRLEIASDMFAHNSAAFETSGNTDAYLFYEMCRNPKWQTRLREELLTLSPQLKYVPGKKIEVEDLPPSKDVDNLPILHAILTETLRLYPSVPGGQPRKVPKPCTLGGYDYIPAGTVVQAYAYSLHRAPDVFPDPEQWKPERWLDASAEELAAMKHWFWAFGSGGRMCIGSHFAYYCTSCIFFVLLGLTLTYKTAMKFLIASIYTNFTTSLHDHGDMELIDAYVAGPKGHRVEVIFHPL